MLFSFSTQKLLQRYKVYLLPVVTVVLVIGLTITFLQPKISDILRAREELSQGKSKLDRLTQKASTLSSLDQTALRSKFKTLEGALPSEKDIPGFLVGIQRIANEASISVEAVELSAGSISTGSAQTKTVPGGTNSSQVVTAKVTIKGTFGAIRAFLDKSSQTRRLVSIKGISLGGTEAQKASGEITIDLSFSIYFQPLPTTLGEISASLPQITTEEDKIYQKIANFPLYSSFEGVGGISVPVGKTDLFR